MAQIPPVGQGLLVIEASRSRSDTPHSVRLLWTSDQPYAETYTLQHTQKTDIHACCGIRTRTPIRQAAADRAATKIGQANYECFVEINNYKHGDGTELRGYMRQRLGGQSLCTVHNEVVLKTRTPTVTTDSTATACTANL